MSQVVELDLAVLAPACSLADLTSTLRFPHAYPKGEMDLRIAAGTSGTFQRRVRDGEKQLEFTFRDLPPARVHALLRHPDAGTEPPIHLAPIDLVVGENVAARDVVAESSLRVVLTGREGLAEDGVSVVVRSPDGDCVVANWPRGDDTRFEHLTATAVYAQAVAYYGRRCSPIVGVDLGVGQSHELALQLVPAAQIGVDAGAFAATVRELVVHYPGQPPYHVGLRPERAAAFWLPLGEPRVEWAGGSRALRVAPGMRNRWP